MTDKTILKLQDVSRIYVLGDQKNARKAQKAIEKIQKEYVRHTLKNDAAAIKQTGEKLLKAQKFFAAEKYEQSYRLITGKSLKLRRGRGSVVHALDDVNIDIKSGDLVAVMGPSGSGKSTLLNMLGLLDQPTAGQIFIDGVNATALKSRKLPILRSRELGFVFQSFNLVPTLTALENVMLPLKYKNIHLRHRRQLARQALDQVGLGDRLEHRPAELSGGQQQRVAIARSIVSDPAIILADELTGELDSKMTDEVIKLVLKLNKNGQTFIIVTHNPDVAKYCRRIIYMKDGKIDKQVKAK